MSPLLTFAWNAKTRSDADRAAAIAAENRRQGETRQRPEQLWRRGKK